MKPKVNWRCLKTDAPTTKSNYWLNGSDIKNRYTTDPVCCLVSPEPNCSFFRPDQYIAMGYTHWAPYEAPEPPPKPTPFEEFVKSSTYQNIYILTPTESAMERHRKLFEAGYAAAVRNLRAGGAS